VSRHGLSVARSAEPSTSERDGFEHERAVASTPLSRIIKAAAVMDHGSDVASAEVIAEFRIHLATLGYGLTSSNGVKPYRRPKSGRKSRGDAGFCGGDL
jgi:hypothetical protein